MLSTISEALFQQVHDAKQNITICSCFLLIGLKGYWRKGKSAGGGLMAACCEVWAGGRTRTVLSFSPQAPTEGRRGGESGTGVFPSLLSLPCGPSKRYFVLSRHKQRKIRGLEGGNGKGDGKVAAKEGMLEVFYQVFLSYPEPRQIFLAIFFCMSYFLLPSLMIRTDAFRIRSVTINNLYMSSSNLAQTDFL